MGNSTSQNEPKPILSPTQRQFVLPQYGGKVFVDKQKNSIFKIVDVPSQEDEIFIQMIVPRLRLKHPHLAEFKSLEPIGTHQKSFCTPIDYKYRIQYELLTYSMFHQIQRYCKLQQPFPESEICRIFQAVVQCLDYMRHSGTLHGDIKVSSIFLDKFKNVKLMDSFMLKLGKTNYEVVLQDPKSMSLLSPEQLDLLRIKLYDSLEGTEQNQIFMVGLTMLEVATIQQGMKGYNLDNLTMNEQFFMSAMRNMTDCGYSFELSNLIMNCVHKIPNKRPNFNQFLRQIRALQTINSPFGGRQMF